MQGLFFVLISLLFVPKVSAQLSTDIMYLKSGTQLIGVIDSIKRDTVFFRVNARIPVAYPMSQIEKFSMQQDVGNRTSKNKPQKDDIPMPDSGHYFAIQNNMSIRGITAQLSAAYRLNYFIQPMASVEMARYIEAGGSFLSLMGGMNGDFKRGKRSPYYSMQAGYGFNMTTESQWDYGIIKDKKGGFKMETSFGIRQRNKENDFIWTYGVSVTTQRAEYTYDRNIWDWVNNTWRVVEVQESINYIRFNLKLGLIL